MHPDLYYVIHQQRERELEASLRHRRVSQERAPAPRAPRRRVHADALVERLAQGARAARPEPRAAVACCPA